jgi:hypothetical protein
MRRERESIWKNLTLVVTQVTLLGTIGLVASVSIRESN